MTLRFRHQVVDRFGLPSKHRVFVRHRSEGRAAHFDMTFLYPKCQTSPEDNSEPGVLCAPWAGICCEVHVLGVDLWVCKDSSFLDCKLRLGRSELPTGEAEPQPLIRETDAQSRKVRRIVVIVLPPGTTPQDVGQGPGLPPYHISDRQHLCHVEWLPASMLAMLL